MAISLGKFFIDQAKASYAVAVDLYGKRRADEMHGIIPREAKAFKSGTSLTWETLSKHDLKAACAIRGKNGEEFFKSYEGSAASKKKARSKYESQIQSEEQKIVAAEVEKAKANATEVFAIHVLKEHNLEIENEDDIDDLELYDFHDSFIQIYPQKVALVAEVDFLRDKKEEISVRERGFISCHRASPLSNANACNELFNEKERAKSKELDSQIESLRDSISEYESQIAQILSAMDRDLTELLEPAVQETSSLDESGENEQEVESSGFVDHDEIKEFEMAGAEVPKPEFEL